MAYALENEIFEYLKYENHEVTLNPVIFGSDTDETLKGTLAMLEQAETFYRIWINEYRHPALFNGKPVHELKKWAEFKDIIKAFVFLPDVNLDTTGKDINEMITQRLTFDEYIETAKLMPKKRVMNYKRDLWEQLDESKVI